MNFHHIRDYLLFPATAGACLLAPWASRSNLRLRSAHTIACPPNPPCLAQGLLAAAAGAAAAAAAAAMALLRPASRHTYLVDWYSFRPPDRRERHV